MTVSSDTNRSGPYNGNGVTTAFNYDFRIIDEAHIQVVKRDAEDVETTLMLATDYTVTGVGDAEGGQVTINVAPAAGQTITIVRNVPFVQETDLENQGAYYAETVETAFDLAAMRDQQMAEELARAVKIGVSDDPGELATFVQAIENLAGRILTPAATDPAARDDGSALKEGDIYFNTTFKIMRVYTGDGWTDAPPHGLNMNAQSFVGDGVTTTFDLGLSAGIPANVLAWVNDVHQVPSVEYSVSGAAVTFAVAPANGATIDTLVIATTAILNVPAAGSVNRLSLEAGFSNSVPVSAGEYGAVLDGTPGDLALVKQAWQAAVAAGRPFIVPILPNGPLVIQVPEDFATVQAAHNAMLNWIFPGAMPKYADTLPVPLNHVAQMAVEISVAQGEYVSSGVGIVWNHPAGNVILVKGRGTAGLTFSSLQAATFSSGVHLVRLRFSTWPDPVPVVGRAMRISVPTGTGDYRALEGVWRITAVDSVNQDITLAVYSKKVTVPLTLTVTGGIFVHIPVQFRFTNLPASGADVGGFDNFTTLRLEDVTVSGQSSGTNAPDTDGIICRDGSMLHLQQYCGVLEWNRSGVWLLDGARGIIDYAGICGCVTNLNVIQGAVVDGTRCGIQGATSFNVVINTGAQATLTLGGFGGSLNRGVAVLAGSTAILSGHADKSDYGLEVGDGCHVEINDMRIQGCTTVDVLRSGVGSAVTASTLGNVGTFDPPKEYVDAAGGITTASSATLSQVYVGSTPWNPVSIANGAQTSITFTVTGAGLGMRVELSANVTLQGLRLWGEVTASNACTGYLSNNTGAAVDLGLFTLSSKVTRFI